mmetsp:Transcript_10885/g.23080  ORF Transcript_10885/g.23080 Transcript_10885/m.23080 type:complete len:774 (+) Transcript_10885:35-2356(+)
MRAASPHLLAAILAAVSPLGVVGEPLYDFSAVPITKLDDDSFEATVTADTRHVWVVEYYADWCGHCKAFAKGYGKAAANLDGLVKFGAVNADDAKKATQAAGVSGYPSVKVYLPEVSRNPYTGKLMKTTVDFNGPRNAKSLVDFVTNKLPSKVVAVNDANLDAFRTNGTTPKALLLTKKDGTTPLFKALSLKFAGRMLLGEARASAQGVVQAMGAADFPALFLLGAAEDSAPTLYEGELKPAALTAFLEANAGAEPEASETGAASEPLFETIDKDNFAEAVQGSKEPWLLVFGEVATETLNGMAEAVYGQVKVGKAALDAPFAKKLGVKGSPLVVMLPYGDSKASIKKASTFAVDEAGVNAAKKAALETLPYHQIAVLEAQTVDQWMSFAMAPANDQIASKSICLLFSDKPTPPPLFRSVALAFDGEMAFGMIQSSDAGLMQRFGISKAPAIMVMFPEGSPEEGGQMKLAGMKYDPRMHGPFKYGYIANFVGTVISQRYEVLGKKRDEAKTGMPKQEAPSSKKELGPLPELSASNFEEECEKKGGLCAIALLDGGPDNTNKEAHLEMLTKMRKKRAGGPLVFSWVDATCHPGFAAAFDVFETDLPAFIVLSPSKLKWARAIGAFDADTLGTFGTGVATGRIRTNEIKELPKLEEVDCASLPRGAGALPEETPLDEDFVAEILEEERKEREAREAELAASMPKDAPKAEVKDKSKMTKLEKLEAELEECSAMDLLCAARREKQMKAIEKERALQDKLKEIAKKKKKKAKKAKQA